MKTRVTPLAFLLLGLVACERIDTLGGPDRSPAPQLAVGSAQGPQADRYIVVLRDDIADADRVTDDLVRTSGGTLHFRYRAALKGFAATIPAQAVEGVRRNPNVSFVEADGLMYAIGIQPNPPSWGLDRVDQRSGLDLSYTYENDAAGVRIYIIDTGIRFTHQEYAGRVEAGPDYIDGDGNPADCHGHGSHVAGTVGGSTVGIAKAVTLVAVRVLNCSGSGSYSQVIAGVDWVTANHIKPAVANMSLGGPASASVNTAVNNSVAAGVVYSVAAGNSNANACNYSPASAANALTVGATTTADSRSSFSNY